MGVKLPELDARTRTVGIGVGVAAAAATIVIALICALSGQSGTACVQEADWSSNRVLVSADASILTDKDTVLSESDGTYLLSYRSPEAARAASERLASQGALVESDALYCAADGAGDAQLGSSAPVADLSATGQTGLEGAIAIIDTGISGAASSHVVAQASVIGQDCSDDNGHGTQVAEWLLSQAPDASIYSIKALDSSGRGSAASVLAAVNLARQAGCSMIVLALSGPSTSQTSPVMDCIQRAIDDGIEVVGAAGNASHDASYYIPGAIEDAWIAGACDGVGARIESSNWGPSVDVFVCASSTSEAASKLAGRLIATGSAKPDGTLVFDASGETDAPAPESALSEQAQGEQEQQAAPDADARTALVKYLIVDPESVTGGETISTYMVDRKQDGVLTQLDEHVVMEQAADGTWTFPTDLAFSEGTPDALDFVFARANTDGMVIEDGVSYDASARRAYVSDAVVSSAGADDSDGVCLQLLVSRKVDGEKQIAYSASDPYGAVSLVEHGGSITAQNFMRVQFTLATAATAPNIANADIEVYLNSGAEALSHDQFAYDEATGVLTIDTIGLAIDAVDVEIDTGSAFAVAALPGTYSGTAGQSGLSVVYLASGTDPDRFWVGREECVMTCWGNDAFGDQADAIDTSLWSGSTSDYWWYVNPPSDAASKGLSQIGLPTTLFGGDFRFRHADGTAYGTWNDSDPYKSSYNAPLNAYCRHSSAALEQGSCWKDCDVKVLSVADGADGCTHVLIGFETVYAPYGTDTYGVNQCEGAMFEIAFVPKGPDYHSLSLQKTSTRPEITSSSACYSLAGAEYSVYLDEACTQLATPDKLVTDEDGYTNALSLEPGTYYVLETKASPGFYLDETVHAADLTSGDATVTSSEKPGDDPVGVTLQKVDVESEDPAAQGGAALALAEYTFTYYETSSYATVEEVESHETPARTWVLRTDQDGKTSIVAGLMTFTYNDIEYPYKVSGDDFYMNEAGFPILPVGTLIVRESKAPAGYELSEKAYIIVTKMEDNQVVRYGDWTEDPATGDPQTVARESVKRGDITLTKMDEAAGTPLANAAFALTCTETGESHIIVTDEDGIASTAASHALHTYRTNENDTTSTDPSCGVWFGEGDADDGKGALPYGTYTITELACEANEGLQLITIEGVCVTSSGQTVDVGQVNDPTALISTSAVNAEDRTKRVAGDGTVSVTDTVRYTNLIADRSYTMTGTLMDKATGKALAQDGHEVTASATFTATSASGTVDMTFTFDATGMTGSVVAYERLVCDDAPERVIAAHEDIDDADQTVEIDPVSISTVATDALDGDKTLIAEMESTVIDTVSYTGLNTACTYTMTGTLMDKATGKALQVDGAPVTSSVTFAPTSPQGSVRLSFTFDPRGLEGKTAVAYEVLTRDGKRIASHEDIDDAQQSVDVVATQITTEACEADTGYKTLVSDIESNLVDTISYEHLNDQSSYLVVTVLMDKASGLPFCDSVPLYESEIEQALSLASAEGSITAPDEIGLSALAQACARGGDLEGFYEEFSSLINAVDETGERCLDAAALKELLEGDEAEALGVAITTSEFTPEAQSGTYEVGLDVNSLYNDYTDAVFCEYLFKVNARSTDYYLAAEHADLEDDLQTVTFISPAIETEFLDVANGTHVISDGSTANLADAVSYVLAKPNASYKLIGFMASKGSETDANPVLCEEKDVSTTETVDVGAGSAKSVKVAQAISSACETRADDAGSGEGIVSFEGVPVNDYAEKGIVCYEYLIASHTDADGVERLYAIAAHGDIADADQTVARGSAYDKTGAYPITAAALVLGCGLACAGVGCALVRLKGKRTGK